MSSGVKWVGGYDGYCGLLICCRNCRNMPCISSSCLCSLCCRLSSDSSSAFLLLSSNSMYRFSASTSCLINFAAMLSRAESTRGLFLLILSALFPVKGKQVYRISMLELVTKHICVLEHTFHSSSCGCFGYRTCFK